MQVENSQVVTSKFWTDYGKIYDIFIEFCMKRNTFPQREITHVKRLNFIMKVGNVKMDYYQTVLTGI